MSNGRLTSLLNPRADWVGIVEALYQPIDDGQAWARSVLEALRGSVSVDDVGGAALVVLEHDPERSERAMPFVVGVGQAARFNLSTDVNPLSRELFDALFYSRHLALTHTEAGRQVTAEDRAVLKGMRANWGSADAVGLVAHPEPGVIAFLAWPTRTPRELTKHERAVLSQLTLHLESAYRVRRRPESIVAVVQPDGKIVHREREDLPAPAVAASIRRIDRSRTQKVRRCPEALDLWTALVDGELSVVERLEGGHRYYVLVENAPSTRTHRALTKREVEAVRMAARGLSTKLTAYGLGLTPATISNGLARSAAKLGLSNRLDLVRLASLLVDSPRFPVDTAALTQTEREVFELVRMGLSNADIAARRARSVHTVANQVSAILRKTTSSTRRGLIAGRTKG
jgi:DNA-binding CsgD family transcriptional regulator